ncbi:replication restart helicase PriA [Nitrospira sp. NS4]|uniref:replication restart helicase PriA n=1 Tax=Nitrospira sp. NS4 TaxID=3414498 RepID=UPI003C2C0C0C
MRHNDTPSTSKDAHEQNELFADVIVPRHIAKAFTYLVPSSLVNRIAVGQCVTVPFGRTMLQGAVVALTRALPSGVTVSRLKPIASLAEGNHFSGIAPEMFALSKRVADEYLAPWGQCLRLVTQSAGRSVPAPVRFTVTQEGRGAIEQGGCPEGMRSLLTRIARRASGLSAATVQTAAKDAPRGALQFLQSRQWVVRISDAVPRTRTSVKTAVIAAERETVNLPLMPDPEEEALQRIMKLLHPPKAGRILIHGQTDYRISLLVSAARQVLAADRSVLVIVGEVAKVDWMAGVLRRVTNVPVTVHHGRTQDPGIAAVPEGRPQLVVGTRSAIFRGLDPMGLIWIEGEDDAALKEPQEPHYHAREVAWLRAQQLGVPLVLGSSHPSLESMTAAGGELCTQQLAPERAPHVELVDLSREFSGSPMSARLVAALRETLQQHERVVLFLNRKGYAGALVCRECGWVPRCGSCAVALPYYREKGRLACRYCGAGVSPPDICPTCGSSRLSPVGEGTERVELEVRRLFPDARIVRIEGVSSRGAGTGRGHWQQVDSREWDILIGTQVLFQREPISPVGLVGIVQADSGLHVPDFRAAERTYQLLVDAVSLGRPASAGGRVILQTSLPNHHVMQAIVSHDPARFYDEELKTRQLLGYPPAMHLIHLAVSGKDRLQVEQAAQKWVRLLHSAASGSATPAHRTGLSSPAGSLLIPSSEGIGILGPVVATGMRPKGHVRSHIMVKGRDRAAIRTLVRDSLDAVERAYPRRILKFSVDVDPLEMD